MSYRVTLLPVAERQFDHLPRPVQQRVRDRLLALAENPRPPGATALQGVGGLRVRVGDYRILYKVRDDTSDVIVERIAHRREAYRR